MRVLFFANTDWYLYNFRLPLARYLRDEGHEIVLLSPPGPFISKLQAAGFRTLIVPMQRRSLNPLRELALLNNIRALYSQERPDLVHHFTIKCVVYGSLAARLTGIPACVNAITGLGHVFTSASVKAHLLRPLVRTFLRFALNSPYNRLIVQNPDDQSAFEQAGLIEPQRIRLIRGSGVDTKQLQPTQNFSLLSSVQKVPNTLNPFTILLVGRMLWEKGIGEYVAAARQLRQEGLAVKCLLAGAADPGNPASIPADQLTQWHQDGDVTLLGHVDNIPALLAQSDIAVLPSYREGTPRSLLEAAACGLPLIASDVPGSREIVQHGVNGLLVPSKDTSALAAAIRQLYHDPLTCQRMGQASRAKAVAEFDQCLVFEKTWEVYAELMPCKKRLNRNTG